MKNGQAALEFITTYGWALLAIVAAITALAYFGVLAPSNYVPASCSIEPPFGCTQFKAQLGTGIFTEITNGAGTEILDITIHFSTNDGRSCSASTVPWPVDNVRSSAILSGQPILWDTGACANLVNLDTFRGNFTIIYRYAGESVSHKAVGGIVTKVER